MSKIVIQLLFILFSTSAMIPAALAQSDNENGEISGRIVDSDNNVVPNATVAIYDETETDLISGTNTDEDGAFSISIESGNYVLVASYVSFTDHRTTIALEAGENLDLGTITLRTGQAQLDEVIIEGERSYMEMNFDSRSFNVGADITSLGGSALDVLDNVPSITTDFEGNVSLRGNQGVQILINGRPSNLVSNGTDALGSIPSSMIEEIEVITNPSARYAADGTAGIINIILVDNTQLGFNGSLQANTGLPQDHGIGANLNYHVNNINWFLNLDLEYENQPRDGNSFQSFSADTTYAFDQFRESEEIEREASAYFGADFYLPNDQVLTAASRINFEDAYEETDLLYTDYDPGEPGVYQNVFDQWEIVQQTNRQDIEENRESDYDIRLQYENQIGGSRAHRLTADVDFEFGTENEDSDLIELIEQGSGDPRNQRAFGDEEFREFRFDVDYERPLGDDAKFELGFRSNFDWMDNNYFVEDFQNGEWVPSETNVSLSDNFTYFENVNALYSMYSGKAGPFSFQAGVRAENTRIQTELDQTGEGSDQNYLNFFPSLFFSYTLNEQNSFQISYSRRISRPWSRMLLPFTEITDSRNRNLGNPQLRPEFGNSYEAGYLRYWETGSILTSVYYRYRTDVIERVSNIDGQGITTRQPINLATEDSWGIEFSADQDLFENFQLSGSLNLYQSNREGEFEDRLYTSESESFTSRVRIRWRFLEGWNFQSFMFFRGARQTTQGRDAGSAFVGSGISKKVLNDRGTLSLNVRDLFNSRQSDREIIEPESYTLSRNSWSSRSFRLNFRYNFGGEQPNRGR